MNFVNIDQISFIIKCLEISYEVDKCVLYVDNLCEYMKYLIENANLFKLFRD